MCVPVMEFSFEAMLCCNLGMEILMQVLLNAQMGCIRPGDCSFPTTRAVESEVLSSDSRQFQLSDSGPAQLY